VADWLTQEQRTKNMSAIRSHGTKPEKKLAELLLVRFPGRTILERPTELPGRPDFYLPDLNMAVFVDGCFWHGCPKHGRIPADNRDYWEPKLARNMARDRQNVEALKSAGIRPVRIWDHELKGDMRTAKAKLTKAERAAEKKLGYRGA
jgi:DNA mismatch endonuclease (patch repair protein)